MITISDTGKWNDKRHRELSLLGKVMYDYLWDNSDLAGFYILSDAEVDSVRIGCDPEDFRATIKELSTPKKDPQGTTHRGFVLVGAMVWISHKIKHTQLKFGKSKSNQHIPSLRALLAHYDKFHGESEYRKVIEDIDDDLWDYFKVTNPLRQEIRLAPKIHESQKSVSVSTNIFNETMDLWNKITRLGHMLSQPRIKKIQERISDGYTLADFEKVFKYKFNEWKDDPNMSRNLNLDTILKSEHFQKYLEQSKSSQNGSKAKTASFVIPN